MADRRPIIGITLGDPAGIGPEIVLGALQNARIYERCVPVVVGNADILRRCCTSAGVEAHRIETLTSIAAAKGECGTIDVIHVELPGMLDIKPGAVSREAGLASDAFIKRACEMGRAGEIDAICTAPINKESLRLANVEHIGHTEMLAAYLDAANPLTLFMTENMRIFFLSRHLSLAHAIKFISEERVFEFITRVHAAMTDFGFVALP